MNENYVNSNGEVLAASQFAVNAKNRSYLYGDGVFESIRVIDGNPVNLSHHLSRLREGASVLKINIHKTWDDSFFLEKINELLVLSNIEMGGKIRISIDRKEGGTYLPISNDAEFLIEVGPLTNNEFVINDKGLVVDQFKDINKQVCLTSNYKTKNGLLYIMSSLYAQENELDDVLLIAPNGNILESTNSNLFVVSNGMLYTPGLDEGCLAGVMRMTIINLALENGIRVYECGITPRYLLSADAVILTNAIQGVRWVERYKSKVYDAKMAEDLVAKLNEKFVKTFC